MDVIVETAEYAPGKLADTYRPTGEPGPIMLLWHGSGGDERHKLADLATKVAQAGVTVVVPDWRSDGPDLGREQLQASSEFTLATARNLGIDPARLVLAGWSLGACSAFGVAAGRPGGFARPAAVIGIAGVYQIPAPTTGKAPLQLLTSTGTPTPSYLIHGTQDSVVPVAASQEMSQALAGAGWPVRLVEIEADHCNIVMVDEDGARLPGFTPAGPAAEVGQATADLLIEAARSV